MDKRGKRSSSESILYQDSNGSSLSLSLGILTPNEKDEVALKLESASMRLYYIKNLVKWLNSFKELVTNKLVSSLAVLISPVVSSNTGTDETEPKKTFGYIEGLCFALRQLFDDYSFSLRTCLQTAYHHFEITQILDNIEELHKQIHSKATKVDPTLQKMLHAISRYKRKLPHDLSFLDSQVEALRDGSDSSEITLNIWNDWMDEPIVNDGPYNLEVQWDSSNPKVVRFHDLDSMAEFRNSAQSPEVQATLIYHLLTLVSSRLQESLKILTDIETNVNQSKEILKRAYRRIHEDEQDCSISPSTFYVIMRFFENYIKISVTCFKEISKNVSVIRSLVSVGRKVLEERSNYAPMSKYPKKTHIVIPFTVEDTVLNTLSNEDFMRESESQASLNPLYSRASIRSVVTIWLNRITHSKSSLSINNSLLPVRGKSGNRSKWNQGLIWGKFAGNVPVPSPSMSFDEDFLGSTLLAMLNDQVLPLFTRTLEMLKKPNASLSEDEEEIENILGLAMLLATTTLHLNYYKEMSSSQRLDIEEAFQQVNSRLQKLTNPSLHGEISFSLKRLKILITSLGRSLSHTFGLDFDDETLQTALSQVVETKPPLRSHQIKKDVHSFSDNIADHIAEKNGNHLWQAVCGTDAEGEDEAIIFKNPSTHDAHTFARLSVFKRVEIIISLLKYIDDIVTISENNATTVLRQLSVVKNKVRKKIGRLNKTITNGDVNRFNVGRIQAQLYKYGNICHSLTCLSEDTFLLLDFVAHVVKDLKSYVSLTFNFLKMPIKSEETLTKIRKQSPMQMNRKELEKDVMELELTFKKLVNTPFTVYLPLKFAGVSEEQSGDE